MFHRRPSRSATDLRIELGPTAHGSVEDAGQASVKHYWRTAIEVKVRVGRLEAAACVGEKRGEHQDRISTVNWLEQWA